MGKFVYVPDVISLEELEKHLSVLKKLCLKVDHGAARAVIYEGISELVNEVDNIEKGYRNPE